LCSRLDRLQVRKRQVKCVTKMFDKRDLSCVIFKDNDSNSDDRVTNCCKEVNDERKRL
jgi:hypothetical protein